MYYHQSHKLLSIRWYSHRYTLLEVSISPSPPSPSPPHIVGLGRVKQPPSPSYTYSHHNIRLYIYDSLTPNWQRECLLIINFSPHNSNLKKVLPS